MSEWIAPAKVNLSLELMSATGSGMHPLRSLVQTVEWVDRLRIEAGDEDVLTVEGPDTGDHDDNLIWKAIRLLVEPDKRPLLDIRLDKEIPVAAGLGGGSSDAAAALVAVADLLRLDVARCVEVAPGVGSDVSLFLTGGTAWMGGFGESIEALPSLTGFAVGLVVPPFELDTARVYERWDRLDGPTGSALDGRRLPPALRGYGPLRNDLMPAALSLEPQLGDWVADLTDDWERPVVMSGSGPTLFSYFADHDEAASAVAEIAATSRGSHAAELRRIGVEKV